MATLRDTPLAVLIALLLVPRAAGAQGNPLGPEFRVNTYTTGSQSYPSVGVDSSGNFVVVWTGEGEGGLSGDVLGQRYSNAGVPVGPEFRVNTYTTGNQYFPKVASRPNGDFVVVWSSYGDGSFSGVFGQRYDSSGAPLGPEFRVNTYTTLFQWFPSVAFAGSGGFVVVWQSLGQDGSNWGIFGQRYTSSGAPLGQEFRVNTSTANYQLLPAVAADAVGDFVVAWASQELFYGPRIFGQFYSSSGAPLGSEFRVSFYQYGAQTRPSVGADSAGNFVVIWESTNQESGSGIYGRRYSNGGIPVGPEFHVNTFTPGNQLRTDVALDAAGNFAVVWTSEAQDGSSDGIFGQRYDSGGLPLGPEFRVNTYITGAQTRSSVRAGPLGNFVVVWDSQLQDGSATGVFGQRYAPILPVDLMHFRVE